jgi:phosphotriesterase-related protein
METTTKAMGLKGKVQTVLGTIAPDDMGVTLAHEHIFIDMRSFFIEPSDKNGKRTGQQPISLKNLSWIRSHRHSNMDNLTPFDEKTAINEVLRFKKSGGSTIVECTPINMGREPIKLAHVSEATGINIVMGTSYYREMVTTWNAEKGGWVTGNLNAYPGLSMNSASQDDISNEFVRDITIGAGDTGIRAGFIGEIGCSYPLTKNEKKVLCAAVAAQKRTGALITVHPGFNEDSPLEIVSFLSDTGADLTRVVICHMSISVATHETRLKLAKTGCYLEWDLFGWEGVYPLQPAPLDIPSDQWSLRQIIQLIDAGYLNQILISHDICAKIRISRYGGSGYNHILETIVPMMKQKSLTDEQIYTIMTDNPKRAFTFV